MVTPAVKESEHVDGASFGEGSWASMRAPESQREEASMREALDAEAGHVCTETEWPG